MITLRTLHAPYINAAVEENYRNEGKPLPKLMGIPVKEYQVDEDKYVAFMKKAANVAMDLAWKERENLGEYRLGYDEDTTKELMFRHTHPEHVFRLMEFLIVGDWETDMDECKVDRKNVEPLVKKYESFFDGADVSMVRHQHGKSNGRPVWFASENVGSLWCSFKFRPQWNAYHEWLKNELATRAGNKSVEYKRIADISTYEKLDDEITIKVTTKKVEKDAPWSILPDSTMTRYYCYEVVDDMDDLDSVPPAHFDYIKKEFAEDGIVVDGLRLISLVDDVEGE